MIYAYKLVRVRRDGTLGPLFIDRGRVLKIGVWMTADAIRTPGYAYRPGWHATAHKRAPHLSKKGRAWVRVALRGVAEYRRPKAQGGLWYTAGHMRILRRI